MEIRHPNIQKVTENLKEILATCCIAPRRLYIDIYDYTAHKKMRSVSAAPSKNQ